jgi:hypothetical protein
MSLTQPAPPSARSMHGIGNGDFVMSTDSCGRNKQTSRPSTDSSTDARAREEF